MINVDEIYKEFAEKLRSIYDKRQAENIADWVFERIANLGRLDRITNKRNELSNLTIQQLNNALVLLLQHTPVQYVLGEAWFYKMKLFVNEHVLIPRPETEELVEWVVEEIRNKKLETRNKKQDNNSQITLLDIGTGSGCIAIALKKELPNADVYAIDVSKDALQVAKKNAADLHTKINFLRLNFLDKSSWESLPLFDIIISNPPYIPENEKNKLAKNVTEHEPHVALFVKDNDPFIFYKKITSFADKFLKQGGKIFVEVHEKYAKEVEQIFLDESFKPEIKKDVYGRDRTIKALKHNPIIL